MGLVVPFVGYVSGLNADGSDLVSDYVTQKRNFLRNIGIALSDFGRISAKYRLSLINFDKVDFNYTDCVEESIGERTSLNKIDHKNVTLLVTDVTDLCRPSRSRTKSEVATLKKIANSFGSIFFAPGFVHVQRMTDYLPHGDLLEMHRRGIEIRNDLISGNYKKMSPSSFEKIYEKLFGYNMEGHSLIRRKSDKMK